jgi:hypothetical protein
MPGTNAHRFAAMGVRFIATDRPEVLAGLGLVERRGPAGAWRYSRTVLKRGGGTFPLRLHRDGTLTVEFWVGSLTSADERFQALLRRLLTGMVNETARK